jgi:biotin carboxyl carrier protein
MQSQERPVFRQDLVAEAIEEQGARFIDVADPDSGHMFRFFEVEYALACAMDGQRDVAGIVKWAQEELGVTPSPKEVQSVIATLVDLRFIETGATRLSDVPEAKTAAKQAPAVRDEHNEQTVVGAAALPDDDLAPGILVGKTAPAAATGAGAQFELGSSGAQAGSKAPEAPLPKADFDLGAPGAAASTAAKQVKTPAEDIALGASGAKPQPGKTPGGELSMDLAAEMPVKAADVKEAVRASKVMTAVEVPKELQDELDQASKPVEKVAEKKVDKKAEKAAERKAAEQKASGKSAEKPAAVVAKAPEKQPEKAADKKPADKKAEKQPEKAADKKPADKKAVTLPAKPAEKVPVAPPAPEQKISPVLVVLLILAAVGAGAFFFWKFVLAKPDAEPQTKVAPPAPPAPPPPAEATSTVVLETPAVQDIKSPAGNLETVEANDKDVKTGDVLATLVGAKALTTELDKLKADVEKSNPTIETATKALADAQQKENNQAGVTAAQATLDKAKKVVDDKKATITKKQGDLDKLVIKSPTDGKLVTTAKVGQKVAADEVIAKITRATVPVATFKIPPGTKVGADGNVSLATADGKSVVCTVSDAQAETIKVTCPADSGLADGAAVKFTLPK